MHRTKFKNFGALAIAVIALVVALSLAGAASADVGDAIVRVVITGKDVNVRMGPSRTERWLFQASAPAEYIAARYKSVCAGTDGDGSEWYELIGVRGWENFNDNYDIAPSLEGRSAAGALLDRSMYVSANHVRELPLRDGDADAVREMMSRRNSDEEEPQKPVDKFLNARDRYVGSTPLEAAALHGASNVRKWWDTDDEDFSPFAEVRTDSMCGTYLGDWLLQAYIAKSGADIGGIVLGQSTASDVRAILGDDASEDELGDESADGFTFDKMDLSGGAPVHDRDRSTEHTIQFKAAKALHWSFSLAEGMGVSIDVYFDEAGRAVAISQHSYGWR